VGHVTKLTRAIWSNVLDRSQKVRAALSQTALLWSAPETQERSQERSTSKPAPVVRGGFADVNKSDLGVICIQDFSNILSLQNFSEFNFSLWDYPMHANTIICIEGAFRKLLWSAACGESLLSLRA